MVLYVREGLDCITLTVGDNMVKSLWVRMEGKANKADVAVGVYH